MRGLYELIAGGPYRGRASEVCWRNTAILPASGPPRRKREEDPPDWIINELYSSLVGGRLLVRYMCTVDKDNGHLSSENLAAVPCY